MDRQAEQKVTVSQDSSVNRVTQIMRFGVPAILVVAVAAIAVATVAIGVVIVTGYDFKSLVASPTATSLEAQPTRSIELTPTFSEGDLDWLYPLAIPPSFSLCEAQNDWPMVNRNAANDTYTHDFLSVPLHLAWQMYGSGQVSKPILAAGRVYAVDGEGNVFAVDIAKGEVVWQKKIANVQGAEHGLAYSEGRVYLAAYDGTIYAIDAANGQVVWSYNSGSTVNSSPIVFDNRLFVGNWAGHLLALDVQSGDVLWNTEIEEIYSSDVAVFSETVYVVSRDGVLHAIEISSGSEKWQLTVGGVGNGRTPVIRDGILYFSATSEVYAVDVDLGDVLWTQALSGLFYVKSVSVDEYFVYVSISEEYEIVALDRRNGEIRWRTELLGPPSQSGPVVTSRYLLTRMTLGTVDSLVVLDRLRGRILWQKELAQGSVMVLFPSVIVADHMLVLNAGNAILAFKPEVGRLLLTGEPITVWDPFAKQTSNVDIGVFVPICDPLPDTDNLVCLGLDKMRWDLYIVRWETETITKITNFTAKGNATMKVSPSGNQVAFAFGTGAKETYIHHGDLYIIGLENGEEKLVTNNFCGILESFSWSLYGKWLVFPVCVDESTVDWNTEVAVVKVDNEGEDRTILCTIDSGFTNLSWSPDGLWIAYKTDNSLFLSSADGSREIAIAPFADLYIRWSPSGQHIANEPWIDDGTGVYVLHADGSTGRWIIQYRGNIFPGYNPYSWSLDGRYIAHLDRGEIKVFDVCTGDLVELLTLGGEWVSNVKWVP
jgi:outer membrane protein assembly factor BamB